MDHEAYANMPETIEVREFGIEIERRDGKPQLATIVSTITDPTLPQPETVWLVLATVECRTRHPKREVLFLHGRAALQNAVDGSQGNLVPRSGVQSVARNDGRIGQTPRHPAATTEREGDHASRGIVHAHDDVYRRKRSVVQCVPRNRFVASGWQLTGPHRTAIQETTTSLDYIHDDSAKPVASKTGGESCRSPKKLSQKPITQHRVDEHVDTTARRRRVE